MIEVDGLGKLYGQNLWALQNLTLYIAPGEKVGCVGPNGSGKSTFLQLVSRVIWPTTGRIKLGGRVGALLEVGTGFHHELTGRENIYLSGAILGMHRREVKSHFDAIVDFSGVEAFLDIPVKRYSSGMFLRLAFAIMAHLNSAILIIDEIMSVGDQHFQEKCLCKMRELAEGGRTIILVSHDQSLIDSFCTRVITLKQGRLMSDECKAALHLI